MTTVYVITFHDSEEPDCSGVAAVIAGDLERAMEVASNHHAYHFAFPESDGKLAEPVAPLEFEAVADEPFTWEAIEDTLVYTITQTEVTK